MGRPSKLTEQVVTDICARLAAGESLRSVCRDEAMPDKATVFRWLAASENQSFRDQYALACEARAEEMFENMLDIADDGRNDTYKDEDGNTRTDQDVIARSRLRVDTRKWMLARMAPKKYGDKITQEHTGDSKLTVEIIRYG